ncbi:hypothetical protein CPB84DRAFT_1784071 [Gymnopilus junonius]|uniref:Uncharacterized protein n=1 Tax=Gymnopilus junonius TaxID=109634 RepID=A0A9P5NHB8_GYMJU|nr:hypothetical protein CPB84DRAFT_1784071 [Gymnopilus junonius]
MRSARTPSPGPIFDSKNDYPPPLLEYNYVQYNPWPYNQVPPSPRIMDDRPVVSPQNTYPSMDYQPNQSTTSQVVQMHGQHHTDMQTPTSPHRFHGHWTPPPNPPLSHRTVNPGPTPRRSRTDHSITSTTHNAKNDKCQSDPHLAGSRYEGYVGGKADARDGYLGYEHATHKAGPNAEAWMTRSSDHQHHRQGYTMYGVLHSQAQEYDH